MTLAFPLRFEPYFRPMIWGGRGIARFLGKNLPTDETYGESWEVSDHALHQSRLATASLFGVTLRQLMLDHRRELLGSAADRFSVFPWLIKLLDAHDWLSVQVHPDEDAVKKLWPGESAKTEAWHVLDAAPDSKIYAGLKPGVGPDQLRHALSAGNVVDCLHSFVPRPGDLVFLPAGTVHALGGGILLAEIQQTSDATFRLFDWNRRDAQGQPRPLHIEESFASIHWDQGSIKPIRSADARVRLVTCPYFEIEQLQEESAFAVGDLGRLQALIVTQGQGRFDNGEFAMAGDVWVLPATMPRM
ncbi:MAG: class I mannose-6-phosphate isomerase, partial [Planctomycetes bacterium]|nr:class I mannose-6-phosphate isomerase [Planctomycetota bacterium]